MTVSSLRRMHRRPAAADGRSGDDVGEARHELAEPMVAAFYHHFASATEARGERRVASSPEAENASWSPPVTG